MLRELRINNFKGWSDTGIIKMAPITLLFGQNSSGKSSIGQFLMMLRQTVDLPDRKVVFYPGIKNSAVKLGSFQEMVYHRNPQNKIIFEYTWDLLNQLRVRDPITGRSFTGKSMCFRASAGLDEIEQKSVIVNFFEYCLLNDERTVFSIGMERRPQGTKANYSVESKYYQLKRKPGRVWYPEAPVRFYGFPDEVVAYHQNADFVQDLNLRHEKLYHSLFYLGPLRTTPERLYPWAGSEPESVGYSGENTVSALLAAHKRKISLGYKKQTKMFDQIIAEKLRDMGLIEQFKVNPISEQRQEYEVKVQVNRSQDWVDLPDVGFGISQVLPVLVQSFYAPPSSIIIMEQPEIHLHPSAQAALADVMIDVINSKENGSDRNIQLIIETHSEHFLRRLQRRISEDVLPSEKVAAYFANVNKASVKLESLKIDLFGNILNWPENFFGDDMGDIIAQAKNAMEKSIKKKQDKRNE